MLLQSLIIIRIIKHSINNTVLVDKFSDLFLLEYKLENLFEFIISFRIHTMNINKKMLSFKICSRQIQEECTKGKVYPRLVIFIKGIDKVPIILDPLPAFVIFLLLLGAGLQDIFAYLFGLVHKVDHIIFSVRFWF